MSVLVIGVNHRSGPLSVLERVSLSGDEVPKAARALAERDNVREAVVVSTCNRTEVYAVAERFHGAYADIRDFLCDLGGLAPDDLHPHLYTQHDEFAVRHLFEVAAGLDSAVVGETEILGQLRTAWELAQREGAARSTLNLLFRRAVVVGKRARTETAIARGTASVSHAAVEMVIDRFGSIEGRRVLVVGAGAMGEGITVALRAAGVGDVVVVNRTAERGAALAERVGAAAHGFDRLAELIDDADIVLSSTGSGSPILTTDLIADRSERPLLVVDVAVPRDVGAGVAELGGVTVFDLDDVGAWAERGRAQRLAEVASVEEIIADELDRYAVEATSLQAAPLVRALRSHAETVRTAEMERLAKRLRHLDPADLEAVDVLTKGIIAKLLHEPSVRLRAQAGTPQGARNAAALTDLFDLG
ncbi:MAG: glutamyl-tRNA reductase [Ilumatobacteraceae bacterium]